MQVLAAIWDRKFGHFSKLNSALVALIPKKEGADQVKDFRPISLVHSMAKLATKILANRLGISYKLWSLKGRVHLLKAGSSKTVL
jgi:hypothetical protein